MATRPVEIEILMRDRLTGDLDSASNRIEQIKSQARDASSELEGMSRAGDRLAGIASKIAGAFAMKEVVSNIVKVRGEMQQLEVALNTMLGSAEKAEALTSQLINTAATTPFGMNEIANAAKQLLAYGVEAENVNSTLIRLGDIAAGLSIPFGDLAYLYGTTMVQGRMYTQDLNQFLNRGIPIVEELANVLGVAQDQVRDLVSAGKIGFAEVEQAINNLTGEGSKFGGLMEEQSVTISGRISNIEDAIEQMFNEIGKNSEGIIGGALDTVSALVENYEQVGRVLAGLVATYGVYKAAVMAVTAVHNLQKAGVAALTIAETVHYGWVVIVEKAQKLLNATMLANPYVLVATLIAGVVAAMVSMKTEAERLKEAEEEYQAAKQETIAAEEEHRRKLEELCRIASDESLATDTRRQALNQLEQKYPDIFAKYDTEYDKLQNIKQIKEEIAQLEASQSITIAQNELDAVERRIAELQKKQADVEYVTTTTMSGTYTTKIGGLNRKEEAELKNLQSKRKELSKTVRKQNVNAYFEDLTGVSNDTLQEQIKQRENLLARMQILNKQYGQIVNGDEGLTGTFSRDELQYQLNKLRSEQNKRSAATGSSTEWAAQSREEARQAYEQALNEYNAFVNDTTNSLTRVDYEAEAQRLKSNLEAAKTEWDKYQSASGGSRSKSNSNAEKERAEREKAEQKAADTLLALQKQNQQAELDLMEESTQKKLAQIDADFEKRKAEIEQKAAELAAANQKAGTADTNENGLTQEQQAAIDQANLLSDENRKKQILEVYNAEAAALRDYLQQYGTYQQQKLAIAQEYAEKIRQAGSQGERMLLEKERDSRLSGIEAQELRDSIDWQTVFGGFGGMFEEMVTPVLEKAKAYMQTDEFKNADQSSQQALVEAVQQMEKSISGSGTANFSQLGRQVKEYQTALANLQAAQEEYHSVFEELTKAQDNYREAIMNGTQEEQEAAQAALDTAQQNEQAMAENVEALQKATDTAKQAMTDTANTLKTSMEGVISGLQQITSGSLNGVYTGLIELGNSAKKIGGTLGDAFGKVAETLQDVPIVGWILSIIDIFKDGASDLVESLIDGIFSAISGIISDVLSGDLVLTLVESLIEGIIDVVKSLVGLDTITFWDGNAEALQESIDKLIARNEILADAIEDLTETISEAGGSASKKAYEQAAEKQKEYEQNLLDAAYKQSISWEKGSHSWNYYWNKSGGFTDEEKAQLSELIDRDWDGSLWSLSPEEMETLRNYMPDTWERILDTEGGDELGEYLEDYIEQSGVSDALREALNEAITGVSFDSVYDSFIDQLMDMDTAAADFADDFSEYMFQAMLSFQAADMLKEEMQKWYDQWATYMEDGELSEDEIADLRKLWDEMVESGIAMRDSIAEATGYTGSSTTSQSGQSGSFTAMTYDQGTKLEGMFTSGLMHWASMDTNTEEIATQMTTVIDHLQRIEENTGNTADHLSEIKEDIKKIIRDGLKVK